MRKLPKLPDSVTVTVPTNPGLLGKYLARTLVKGLAVGTQATLWTANKVVDAGIAIKQEVDLELQAKQKPMATYNDEK